jgi:hypothetical protein
MLRNQVHLAIVANGKVWLANNRANFPKASSISTASNGSHNIHNIKDHREAIAGVPATVRLRIATTAREILVLRLSPKNFPKKMLATYIVL